MKNEGQMKPHKNSGDMFTFKSLSFDPTSSSGQQTPPHVLFLKCVHHSFNVGGAFETHRDANITQPEFIFGSASERSGEPRNCPTAAPHCQIFKTTKHDQASSSLTVRLPLQEPERMLKNTCKKMKHAIAMKEYDGQI